LQISGSLRSYSRRLLWFAEPKQAIGFTRARKIPKPASGGIWGHSNRSRRPKSTNARCSFSREQGDCAWIRWTGRVVEGPAQPKPIRKRLYFGCKTEIQSGRGQPHSKT